MTDSNDTEVSVYNQLMKLKISVDALKDVYQNIPEDDRYASVLRVVGERIEKEVDVLSPMILKKSFSSS